MSVILPIPAGAESAPFWTMTAVLDGTSYTLQFRWNTRAGAYWMTLLDGTGETVILGDHRIITILPMWYSRGANAGPPGALVFLNTTGAPRGPGFGELGSTVVLLYYTAAELGRG